MKPADDPVHPEPERRIDLIGLSARCKGREVVRRGIAQAETAGLLGSELLAVLMSETLPRLVNAYGSANASLILIRIARDIASGAAPNCTRQ